MSLAVCKSISRIGVEIGSSDVNSFADVGRGDALGEFVGGLVVVFGNLAMTVLVIGYDLGCPGWYPDVDLQLQVHLDLRDGYGRVCWIGSSRLAANAGSGQEIGITLRAFTL